LSSVESSLRCCCFSLSLSLTRIREVFFPVVDENFSFPSRFFPHCVHGSPLRTSNGLCPLWPDGSSFSKVGAPLPEAAQQANGRPILIPVIHFFFFCFLLQCRLRMPLSPFAHFLFFKCQRAPHLSSHTVCYPFFASCLFLPTACSLPCDPLPWQHPPILFFPPPSPICLSSSPDHSAPPFPPPPTPPSVGLTRASLSRPVP